MAMNNILGLFAQSPLKPLQKHSVKVTECSELLEPFFEATFKQDWDEAIKVREQIIGLERRADALKREIRLKLPRGLFLPVERTDLLELVTQLDKLANYSRDISGRIIGRQLVIPEAMQATFRKFLSRSLDSTRQVRKVLAELDKLLETGFRGRELKFVNNMILELDQIEDDTDQIQIVLRRTLRGLEQEFNPIDVIFLYKCIERVSILADQAQRVGSRIELMLAKA
ncbi:TIGR00153 family protein [[Haemophilus] ducreyi]|uniref:TIGR00153 family protein n=1 Tax=Haemophilus ducreyi TaxID=730 RepID=UPI000654EAC7|nr:TIGR00153 family protein [[Haemophilus] ducreyi]AKO45587.1 phosphate transport regulator [[Haemophilus] ducreyi]AKO46973.1 phosphate transport regulator [[Haemophilus] ducreyi]AKO48317.1 phosphate transport regulator [[Haemophilus] ducreyi]AKO49705.1 phosphate transport regulator [[Haemophilus] ducreyi]ANF61309.1 phosphate transport regulator [[Haemophilus] ducreyi]